MRPRFSNVCEVARSGLPRRSKNRSKDLTTLDAKKLTCLFCFLFDFFPDLKVSNISCFLYYFFLLRGNPPLFRASLGLLGSAPSSSVEFSLFDLVVGAREGQRGEVKSLFSTEKASGTRKGVAAGVERRESDSTHAGRSTTHRLGPFMLLPLLIMEELMISQYCTVESANKFFLSLKECGTGMCC